MVGLGELLDSLTGVQRVFAGAATGAALAYLGAALMLPFVVSRIRAGNPRIPALLSEQRAKLFYLVFVPLAWAIVGAALIANLFGSMVAK